MVCLGYRIQYDQFGSKTTFGIENKSDKKYFGAIVAIILCCVIVFAVGKNLDFFSQWLLPGDPEITKAALTDFAVDLRNGISFKEAATAFCKTIIEDALY